jgi:hypothetical protein
MRKAVKIIVYTNIEADTTPTFEDDVQARIESVFEHDNNIELEIVEFEYEEE